MNTLGDFSIQLQIEFKYHNGQQRFEKFVDPLIRDKLGFQIVEFLDKYG